MKEDEGRMKEGRQRESSIMTLRSPRTKYAWHEASRAAARSVTETDWL